jgi:hypothetical protein
MSEVTRAECAFNTGGEATIVVAGKGTKASMTADVFLNKVGYPCSALLGY